MNCLTRACQCPSRWQDYWRIHDVLLSRSILSRILCLDQVFVCQRVLCTYQIVPQVSPETISIQKRFDFQYHLSQSVSTKISTLHHLLSHVSEHQWILGHSTGSNSNSLITDNPSESTIRISSVFSVLSSHVSESRHFFSVRTSLLTRNYRKIDEYRLWSKRFASLITRTISRSRDKLSKILSVIDVGQVCSLPVLSKILSLSQNFEHFQSTMKGSPLLLVNEIIERRLHSYYNNRNTFISSLSDVRYTEDVVHVRVVHVTIWTASHYWKGLKSFDKTSCINSERKIHRVVFVPISVRLISWIWSDPVLWSTP